MAKRRVQGQATKKWLAAMKSQNVKDNYIAGVKAVEVSPMELAAEADEKYLRNVEEAVRSGRRRRNLLARSLQYWQDAAGKTGAERLSSGATKGEKKYDEFEKNYADTWDSIAAETARMRRESDGSEDSSLERVRYAMRRLREKAGKA